MNNWFADWFTMKTIKEINSPINGLIKVMMIFNRPRLIMGGMLQSGGIVVKLWLKAIAELAKRKKPVQKVLIVGLGCGDCAFAIQKYYPGAKMLGVEIDREVVNIAQCYFSLATVKNLKISIDDGSRLIKKLSEAKKISRFDLVILDAYLGDKIPKAFTTIKFFKSLTKIMTHNGVVILNHLFTDQHKNQAGALVKDMEKIFGKITLQRTGNNLIIFGWF